MAKKYFKKGLSTIVVTLIIILLSLAAVVLVWGFVNNMIKKQISSSESCFGNYDKIKLNAQYTCYERVSSTNYSLRFSLSIGDVQLDKIIVSIGSAGTIKGYGITNTAQPISTLSMYPSGSNQVVLPAINSGLSYKANEFPSVIDSIEIAPVIGGNTCQTSASILQIENCALMA